MEMQLQTFSYQRTNVSKRGSANFKGDDLSSAAIKELLKVIKKNIDKSISSITKLQGSISAEERELKKYFDEEKRLIDCLKDKKSR